MITKMDGKKILLVEDESRIRKLLFDFLSSRGFRISLGVNGNEGISQFFAVQPDIVLLDVMMPEGDGFFVLSKIREHSPVPVIMITARIDIEDRIRGLEAGADDYVCKPFSFKELESRILANLRYAEQRGENETAAREQDNNAEFQVGGLQLNSAYHSCRYKGKEVQLTAMQFTILRLLMEGKGRVFSRNQIGNALSMNGSYEGFQRTIDAHIKNLRKSLQAAGCDGNIVETVRGVGYKILIPQKYRQ